MAVKGQGERQEGQRSKWCQIQSGWQIQRGLESDKFCNESVMADIVGSPFCGMEVSESYLQEVNQCQGGCKVENTINSFYKGHYSEGEEVTGISTLKRNFTVSMPFWHKTAVAFKNYAKLIRDIILL